MRILHLNDRLSARGGADQHLLGVLSHQVRHGWDVTLAVGRIDGTAPPPCNVIEVSGVDARDTADVAIDPSAWDLVHVHNVVNPTALALGHLCTVQDHRAFCPGQGKLTRSGARCSDPFSATTCEPCFTDRHYFERLLNQTRQRLDVLRTRPCVVLSEYMRAELAAVGVSATVIPPFVHQLVPAAPSGPDCVLFVGRLVRAKGVWDAIAVHERLATPLPLVFAGTGRERSALEAAGYEVTGWLDRTALAATYARAACVVMPSRWQEPFGIVGLEAAALGVPIRAWDSGGVAEWHPVPPSPWGDVDALAAAVRAAIGAPDRPDERFAAAPLMSRLYALYHHVLSEHP